MSRKEQIKEAAQEWVEKNGTPNGPYPVSMVCSEEIAFEAGASWADKNHDYTNDELYQRVCRDWKEANRGSQILAGKYLTLQSILEQIKTLLEKIGR